MSAEALLKVEHLTIQFGGLKAVADLNLQLTPGSIFGLIGPNGAGKTTVFNMLTGVYRPTAGSIQAFGKNLIGLRPYQITSVGLARTFQNIRLFKDLTVLDNLLISMDHDPATARFGPVATLLRLQSHISQEDAKRERAFDLLKIFKMDGKSDVEAKNLPYGDQRRLEIARALATGARLLLLDEPAAGMNSNETGKLMDTIRFIREHFKATIFLIEHDMKLVMGICEKIAVLDYGVKIAEGTPSEIQANSKVIEAYLGKAATQHGQS